MRIVYYRDAVKGTITHHHPARDDMTDEQLNQEISKFNAVGKGDTKAALVIVEPGSFEEYLLVDDFSDKVFCRCGFYPGCGDPDGCREAFKPIVDGGRIGVHK